jgi:hypothetical protein
MATPNSVNWLRGPWAQPSALQPPQAPPMTVPSMPEMPGVARAYRSLIPSAGDTGSGMPSSGPPGAPSGWGPMTAEERQSFADVMGFGAPAAARAAGMPSAVGTIAGNLASRAIDLGIPGFSQAVGLAKTGVLGASKLAAALGAMRENNPYAGLRSPEEIQSLRDIWGNMIADRIAAEEAETRAAIEGAQRAAVGTGIPDVQMDPSINTIGGGGIGGGGSAGDPGADTAGFGGGEGGVSTGGGYDMARGGVLRSRWPTRINVSETGRPETSIFIPQSMQRPGFQGREREVRGGLKSAYRRLVPGGRITAGG